MSGNCSHVAEPPGRATYTAPVSDSNTSKVSLGKSTAKSGAPTAASRPTRPGRMPAADIPKVPTTRTIDLAALVAGLLALALWVRALGLLGHQSGLEKYAIQLNQKADKPDKNFDAANYVHSVRLSAFVTAALLTAIMVLLIWAMRRTRSASVSRWGIVIILVLLGIPYSVVPVWGLPFLAQAAGVASGVASVLLIVLVFLPQSTKYFRACREAMTPPELRGQPRPGLGSLFRPRQQAGTAGPTRPATTRPAAKPSSSKAKAKVRADAEAVAKGAELARTRAKTSKTRR